MIRKIVLVFALALVGALGAAGIASAEVDALQGVLITAQNVSLLYPYIIGGGLVGGILGFLISLIPPILSR